MIDNDSQGSNHDSRETNNSKSKNRLQQNKTPPPLNESPSEERARLKRFADSFGLEFVELDAPNLDPVLLARFSAQELSQHNILPLEQTDSEVVLAVSDPFQVDVLNRMQVRLGMRTQLVLAPSDQISRVLKQELGIGGGIVSQMNSANDQPIEIILSKSLAIDSQDNDQAASVLQVVNELLLDAIKHQASDIHIEPEEDELLIRYRIDGVLQPQPTPPGLMKFTAAIISRIKIMAELNIAEKRLPQDGSIQVRVQDREIDVRVSTIPMLHGEGVVLRILDKSRMVLDLDRLEFPEWIESSYRKIIERPHGIVLVTGPTGSGKTTTLYSSLRAIQSSKIKIITVEDPIEYQIRGIRQIQVHNEIGLSFASALRSILRHDPDVILVGEIRDRETAENAIQASLTGHLVFSTLHTNQAAGAFNRLVDMGIEPYLVSNSLEAILAQRLVRKLCDCRVESTLQDFPADFPTIEGGVVHEAHGCHDCFQLGYRGRLPIFELIKMNAELRHLSSRQVSTTQIMELLRNDGFRTLREHGWERVLNGQTSISEVLRVAGDDQVQGEFA